MVLEALVKQDESQGSVKLSYVPGPALWFGEGGRNEVGVKRDKISNGNHPRNYQYTVKYFIQYSLPEI